MKTKYQNPAKQEAVYCLCITGKNESGNPQYMYVVMQEKKIAAFKRIAKAGSISPEKLGEVIYFGRGELSADLHKLIVDKYIKSAGVEMLET